MRFDEVAQVLTVSAGSVGIGAPFPNAKRAFVGLAWLDLLAAFKALVGFAGCAHLAAVVKRRLFVVAVTGAHAGPRLVV
ncbi:hypothetical protein P3G55_22345 [Leptospira sp. 96542]|nr:hypothetical protein [Leptospira sp. 96542]